MQQPPIYLDINNNKSIITALKAGEEYVFDAVYKHYFSRLCAFCSQYVSEEEVTTGLDRFAAACDHFVSRGSS